MNNVDITLIVTTIITFLGAVVSHIARSFKDNRKSNNKILDMLEKQVNNLTEENIQLRKIVDKQNETINIQNEKIDALQRQIIELVKER